MAMKYALKPSDDMLKGILRNNQHIKEMELKLLEKAVLKL